MWVVAKIKRKELHVFKKEFLREFGSEIKFYNPKEGRDQVMFIYSNALSGEIVKYRILR